MANQGQDAFFTAGEDVIKRTIDVEIDETTNRLLSPHEFDLFYEISRTADEIIKGDFKRVSQFRVWLESRTLGTVHCALICDLHHR